LAQHINYAFEGNMGGVTGIGITGVPQSQIYLLHWGCQLELYAVLSM